MCKHIRTPVDTHQASNPQLTKQELVFRNHNEAVMLKTSNNVAASAIVNALNIKPSPKAIVLIFGGAANSIDTSTISRIKDLLNSVLQLAADAGALIIDGGTKSGIMEIIGERVSMLKRKPFVLGVAPAGKITYPRASNNRDVSDTVELDPNHSHFVLVESNQWGDETETLFEVVRAFDENVRVVALLAGGSEISKKEMLFCVNNRWPIILRIYY